MDLAEALLCCCGVKNSSLCVRGVTIKGRGEIRVACVWLSLKYVVDLVLKMQIYCEGCDSEVRDLEEIDLSTGIRALLVKVPNL